jgi:hypothetical protein
MASSEPSNKKSKHECDWEFLGETSESLYYWCEICGSIKQSRASIRIFRPKTFKFIKQLEGKQDGSREVL